MTIGNALALPLCGLALMPFVGEASVPVAVGAQFVSTSRASATTFRRRRSSPTWGVALRVFQEIPRDSRCTDATSSIHNTRARTASNRSCVVIAMRSVGAVQMMRAELGLALGAEDEHLRIASQERPAQRVILSARGEITPREPYRVDITSQRPCPAKGALGRGDERRREAPHR